MSYSITRSKSTYEFGVEGEHFTTKIKVEYEPFLRQAAKETNAAVVIRDAKDRKGNPDLVHVAVHSTDRLSKQDFWDRYDELKKEA